MPFLTIGSSMKKMVIRTIKKSIQKTIETDTRLAPPGDFFPEFLVFGATGFRLAIYQ